MDENEEFILEDQLATVISELLDLQKEFSPGSEEWLAIEKAICDYYDRRIECAKVEQERLIEEARAENNKKGKNKELAIQTALGVAGIGLPLAFYAYWMNKGFKFEQTGTFTSSTFKNLIKGFKPTKIG